MIWLHVTDLDRCLSIHIEFSFSLVAFSIFIASRCFLGAFFSHAELPYTNIYPSIRISTEFLCLTLKSAAKQGLKLLTLWSLLTTYLNILFDSHVLISKLKCESFPLLEIITYCYALTNWSRLDWTVQGIVTLIRLGFSNVNDTSVVTELLPTVGLTAA
ncbi:DNA/RNA-binding domain E.t1.c1-type [Penicillium coprophilum]|uniref:DNA/RNA-binding domain E.t1.c1-type n=1 Tax=Penicillium coprophilum TaxID=36646 RepID=UPI0023A2B047|nr:DNA/RNA-binding domain E.t1.c1-type [Penicillium coprophilum]KAJ5159059.1 DNA/RNA-binding domain E.t1.c1-type [Penicillium coprophilum]